MLLEFEKDTISAIEKREQEVKELKEHVKIVAETAISPTEYYNFDEYSLGGILMEKKK